MKKSCASFAVSLLLALPCLMRAEFVLTPGAVPGLPLTSPVADGTPIAAGPAIGPSYMPYGIEFGPMALVQLNGVTTWAPTNNFWLTGPGDKLNFTDGVIWGAFGVPGTDDSRSVKSVTAEFLGVPEGQGWVNGFDSEGRLISFMNAWTPGPHGGLVATVNYPDIAAVVLTKSTYDADPTMGQPWGVAEIRFDSPFESPEPGSIVLALAGVIGLASFAQARFRLRQLIG